MLVVFSHIHTGWPNCQWSGHPVGTSYLIRLAMYVWWCQHRNNIPLLINICNTVTCLTIAQQHVFLRNYSSGCLKRYNLTLFSLVYELTLIASFAYALETVCNRISQGEWCCIMKKMFCPWRSFFVIRNDVMMNFVVSYSKIL